MHERNWTLNNHVQPVSYVLNFIVIILYIYSLSVYSLFPKKAPKAESFHLCPGVLLKQGQYIFLAVLPETFKTYKPPSCRPYMPKYLLPVGLVS